MNQETALKAKKLFDKQLEAETEIQDLEEFLRDCKREQEPKAEQYQKGFALCSGASEIGTISLPHRQAEEVARILLGMKKRQVASLKGRLGKL